MVAINKAADLEDPALLGWQPNQGSADSDLIPELPMMLSRSRDLVRNNGLAAGYVQTVKDSVLGHQLKLSAKPDLHALGWSAEQGRDWSRTTESWFRAWAESTECDAGRSQEAAAGEFRSLHCPHAEQTSTR